MHQLSVWAYFFWAGWTLTKFKHQLILREKTPIHFKKLSELTVKLDQARSSESESDISREILVQIRIQLKYLQKQLKDDDFSREIRKLEPLIEKYVKGHTKRQTVTELNEIFISLHIIIEEGRQIMDYMRWEL